MNNKGYAQIVGGIVVIALFLILILYILPQLSSPVTFEIRLKEANISQSQNGVLFYKITNNKNAPIYDLKINNSIVGYESTLHEEKIITVIPNKQFVVGTYNFDTRYLSKGNYTIKSVINYIYQNKNDSAELTLKFLVKN